MCQSPFETLDDLSQHLSLAHAETLKDTIAHNMSASPKAAKKAIFKCKNCKVAIEDEQHLFHHFATCGKTTHVKMGPKNLNPEFVCPFCWEDFSQQKSRFKAHKSLCQRFSKYFLDREDKQRECTLCQRIFRQKNKIFHHVGTVHRSQISGLEMQAFYEMTHEKTASRYQRMRKSQKSRQNEKPNQDIMDCIVISSSDDDNDEEEAFKSDEDGKMSDVTTFTQDDVDLDSPLDDSKKDEQKIVLECKLCKQSFVSLEITKLHLVEHHRIPMDILNTLGDMWSEA